MKIKPPGKIIKKLSEEKSTIYIIWIPKLLLVRMPL